MIPEEVHIQRWEGFVKSPSRFSKAALVENAATGRQEGYWTQITHIAPLIVFRILFSSMLLASIIRFGVKGWIEELYIKPSFFFSHYGFEWVIPLGSYTYILFGVCALACVLVAIGLFYRT